MRYYYHPESACLWTEPDDVEVESDGFVEEISEETYSQLLAELGDAE